MLTKLTFKVTFEFNRHRDVEFLQQLYNPGDDEDVLWFSVIIIDKSVAYVYFSRYNEYNDFVVAS